MIDNKNYNIAKAKQKESAHKPKQTEPKTMLALLDKLKSDKKLLVFKEKDLSSFFNDKSNPVGTRPTRFEKCILYTAKSGNVIDMVIISNSISEEDINNIFKLFRGRKILINCNNLIKLPESLCMMQSLNSLVIQCSSIVELPTNIGGLLRLQSLVIVGGNLFTIPLSLSRLTNLKFLTINKTRIKSIPDIFSNMSNLKLLNLDNNHLLADVPPSIGSLLNLDTLSAQKTKLMKLPDTVDMLTNIKFLYLGSTSIECLSFSINRLVALEEIDISDTEIFEFPSDLCNLPLLSKLLIGKTKIGTLPPCISRLNNLIELDIQGTMISELPVEIYLLKQLKKLNLSNITLKELPKSILIFNLPFIDNDYGQEGIFIKNLRLSDMNVNIFKTRTHDELVLYYKELERESVSINEARIIFIGNGDAGKSTIINRLLKGYYVEKLSQTKGVAIYREPFDLHPQTRSEPILLHIWDFGGQEIMHSMHTYFLGERCLYVIVLDGRRDEEPEKWLDLVCQYGKHSSVMLVMNKIDENQGAEIDTLKIKELYDKSFNSLSFHYISCKNGTNFDEFKGKLLAAIEKAESYKMVFPGSWNRVKARLRDMKNADGRDVNYINESDYIKICHEEDLYGEYNQETLLSWLNDLGICFSYKSRFLFGSVEATKVLRPEWITNGIYKIINSELAKSYNGFIPHELIRNILETESGENDRYRSTEQNFILEMMRNFEFSYAVDNSEFFPMLTAKSEPIGVYARFKTIDSISYHFEYESLLPSAILYNIIVRLRDEVNRSLTWRRGVVFERDSCQALIRFGKDNHELDIFIIGDHEEAAYYLNYLIHEIKNAQKTITINFTEKIMYLYKGKTACIDYDRMIGMLEHGLLTDYIQEFREEIDIIEVLRSIKPQFVIDRLQNELEVRNNQPISQVLEAIEALKLDTSEIKNRIQAVDADFLLLRNDIALIENDELLNAIDEILVLLKEKDHSSLPQKLQMFLAISADLVTVVPAISKVVPHIHALINQFNLIR